MKTTHEILLGDARDLEGVADESCSLVVTSPPYPMIEMWDDAFRSLDPEAGELLDRGDGPAAFERMHRQLDRAWAQCFRALRPGGLACINVGDATRKVGGEFRLYSNHSRILQATAAAGFATLPDILWRKPTNAPNKFLGSGMLPAGAYVTYEHEYILILRKGPPREFAAAEERLLRRRSAFFWEERNAWFSDVWLQLRGAGQDLGEPAARERSAAFPLELPYRLVQMFSLQADTVLDPFAGTGTTSLAAAASGRSSVAVEIDDALRARAASAVLLAPAVGRERSSARLEAHRDFVRERTEAGKPPRHRNAHYGFPVVTGQEVDLVLVAATAVSELGPGRLEAENGIVEEAPPGPRQLELSFG